MHLLEVLKTLRPQQWIKNLFLFAPLIFSQNIQNLPLLWKTSAAFGLFCLISGTCYIFNDLQDLKEDQRHPLKSERPLASGRLSRKTALVFFIAISFFSFILAFILEPVFFYVLLAYYLMQIAYSIRLKHIVILDVFIVAAGFFLRVIAGGLVIDVYISPWLLICTLLLALFLALGKRRHEIVILDKKAESHRPILGEYSPHLLDQMIAVVTASTVISYCLYTISAETVEKFGTKKLIYTVPFVLYGIFRYLYLIHQKSKGGSPEVLIIKDRPLLLAIILWIISASLIIYFQV